MTQPWPEETAFKLTVSKIDGKTKNIKRLDIEQQWLLTAEKRKKTAL